MISAGRKYDYEITRYQDPDGRMTKEELSGIAVLEINGDFKEASTVQVRMLKGARSEAHFIGAPEDEEKSFKTVSPFVFIGSSARSYAFPGSDRGDSNPVFFEFSHPVGDGDMVELITSMPDLYIEASNITVWNNMVKI